MTDTSDKKKRKSKDPGERLAELETEMTRVRTREEKRLIQAADKAGFFRHRFSADQTLSLFRSAIDALNPRKRSALAKLEQDVARLRTRMSKAERADDARRKAILGGFLVAQCRHKPEFHAAIAADIRLFLAGHADADVAARNLALLEDFLADPASAGAGSGPGGKNHDTAQSHHRDRARRLILLGAWVLDRQATRADLALLIAGELERFLDQDTHADRHRQLLRDVLP